MSQNELWMNTFQCIYRNYTPPALRNNKILLYRDETLSLLRADLICAESPDTSSAVCFWSFAYKQLIDFYFKVFPLNFLILNFHYSQRTLKVSNIRTEPLTL